MRGRWGRGWASRRDNVSANRMGGIGAQYRLQSMYVLYHLCSQARVSISSDLLVRKRVNLVLDAQLDWLSHFDESGSWLAGRVHDPGRWQLQHETGKRRDAASLVRMRPGKPIGRGSGPLGEIWVAPDGLMLCTSWWWCWILSFFTASFSRLFGDEGREPMCSIIC